MCTSAVNNIYATLHFAFCLESDLTNLTPPPPSSPAAESREEPVHEVIVEQEEHEAQLEEFVCGAEEELDEQDAWEEDTVHSVVETASEIQSKGMRNKFELPIPKFKWRLWTSFLKFRAFSICQDWPARPVIANGKRQFQGLVIYQ